MRFWRRARAETPKPDSEAGNEALAAIDAALRSGGWAAAGALLEAARARYPDHAELLLLESRRLRQQGQPEEALTCCDCALSTAKDPGSVQLEIAECHLALSDLPAALDALQVAVTLSPQLGSAWLRLGEVLVRLDRHVEALEVLPPAIEHSANPAAQARARYVFGQALHLDGRIREAIDAYAACLVTEPDHLEALTAMGHAQLMAEDEPQALRYYELAVSLSAQPSRQLLSNLAMARQNVGDLEGARSALMRLIAENPADYQLRWYLCQLDLLECRWAQGWKEYGSRFGAKASPYRPMPFRPWDGAPRPDDTLLILADQGIGDEVLFASCFQDAMARVGRTVIECEPRLLGLFERSFPGAHCVPTQRGNTTEWLKGLPEPQWQIASGDLPALFRTTDEAFPQREHYLLAKPESVQAWSDRLARELGPGLKVGLSWRGGTPRTRVLARSLGPQYWKEILTTPGVQFVNLQYGNYQEELSELQHAHGVTIHDFPRAVADYDETAALVGALDLVVTVCTAIVHLSGALGTPVWVLTPHVPGWRYTAHRQSMPWYAQSRLFRQPAWGEWGPACQKLAAELRELTRNVRAPGRLS